MAESDRPVVIVKRKVAGGDGHHGGAWKVAYADFATAMMAFFLLLWLLNATSEEQRKGLADFFDPTLPISPVSAGGSGVMGGRDLFFPPPASGTEPEGAKAHEQSTRPGPDLGDERFSPEETDASGPGHGRGAAGTGDETASGPDRRPAGQGAMLGEQLRVFAESLGDGHLSVRGTTEGLVIELGDLADEPLFAPGSAEPTPVLEGLLAVVVPVLGDSINPIALIGHTDARPFSRGGRYSNWELSADRANAARRLMLAEGLAASRIVRIVGKAATEPRLPDPLDPRNRRIAIKLLEMPR